MRPCDIQAILGGNFLNAGLLAIFLVFPDTMGISLILISWAAAYVGAVTTAAYFAHGNILWRHLSFALWGLCVAASGLAIYRVLWSITQIS